MEHREDHADRHQLGGPDDLIPYLDARYGTGGSEATTVSDTASIDLTLTGVNITGVVIPGGVDHNSLANLTAGDAHTQYTRKDLFDANTILKADTDNTPLAMVVPENRVVGRRIGASIETITMTQLFNMMGLDTTGASLDASAILTRLDSRAAERWSFEESIEGWQTVNGTLTWSTVQSYMGTHSIKIVANGVGLLYVYSPNNVTYVPRARATAGQAQSVVYAAYNDTASTRYIRAALIFFNEAKTEISRDTQASWTSMATGTWLPFSHTAVAPAGTRWVICQIEWASDAAGSAPTNGDALYIDEVVTFTSPYTDEMAQDAVGAALTDTASVDFTYNDAANQITAAVLPAGVNHNSLANLTTGDAHTQYTRKDTLTTKGDLYAATAASTPARLGVGTDGQVLTADAASAAGVKWAAAGGGVSDHGLLTGLGDDDHTQYALLLGRAGGQTLIGGTASGDDLTLKSTSHATLGHIDANNEQVANVGLLRIGTGFNSSTNELIAGSAATVSDGSARVVAQFGGARTWDTTAGGSYTLLNSAVSVTATANMTSLIGLNFSPTKAGSGTLTNLIGAKVAPTAGPGTTTTGIGLQIAYTTQVGTTTTATGCLIDLAANLSGTITTGIGLRINSVAGTFPWAMQIEDYPSYHKGMLALGAGASPAYALDIQGTTQDRGVIGIAESSATPTNPASSAGVVIYHKADKLVIGFNNAGTMRYFTLDLTQTGATATWAQSTTAP